MKPIYFFPILLFLTMSLTVHAQEVSTNNRGERIVTFPDGSWRYYTAADSTLLSESQANKDKSKTTTRINKENLPVNTEELVLYLFRDRLTYEKQKIEKKLHRLNEQIRVLEKEHKQATSSLLADKQAITIIENKSNSLRAEIRKTKQVEILNQQNSEIFNNIVDLPASEQINVLADAKILNKSDLKRVEPHQLVNDYFLHMNALAYDQIESIVLNKYKEDSAESNLKPEISSKERRTIPDIIEYSKVVNKDDCSLASKSKTNEVHRTEIKAQEFFNYTPSATAHYFVDKDMIECSSYFSYSRGIFHLHLIFTINMAQARAAFGGIRKNSQLTLVSMDGSEYKLYAYKSDKGKTDAQKEQTIYHAIYQVSNKDIRKLKRNSLDKIKVVWQTGYEEYPIYNVDRIQQQIHCMESFL